MGETRMDFFAKATIAQRTGLLRKMLKIWLSIGGNQILLCHINYEMKTTVGSTSSPNVVIGDPVAGNTGLVIPGQACIYLVLSYS